MTHPAKIGIIGTGWWSTSAHLPALAAHPDAAIVAICDQREDALARAAEAVGIRNTYTDYREMLAREGLDGVIVAVWHVAHYEVTRAITGKSPNGSPAEIGWWTVELLDAAYRSASMDGQAVSVQSLYE